jgi:hypothetical protein
VRVNARESGKSAPHSTALICIVGCLKVKERRKPEEEEEDQHLTDIPGRMRALNPGKSTDSIKLSEKTGPREGAYPVECGAKSREPLVDVGETCSTGCGAMVEHSTGCVPARNAYRECVPGAYWADPGPREGAGARNRQARARNDSQIANFTQEWDASSMKCTNTC